ncbi:DUF1858 domain-containing protein [Rhodovulum euryhalinum]|uniref:Hybrid cluster-associated redox disulfide protein n=1 Tax=Rhodovulum euryhalinum TaxID=35805 RepID=A0A4R2KA33_9RHOB|nr:DUF1858 domain-containing protein [Rhodovulum euryhalinum]TCO68847.1 hybrid cluster-associated redox disulfide protein [Rhodovulum euryhalinum]
MAPTQIDDPDLSIVAVLDRWPAAAWVFLRHRMLCVGCAVAPFHTISDACLEYGLSESVFRAEIARAIGAAAQGE